MPFFDVHYAILISAAICIEKAHLHLSLVFSHPSPGATFVTFYPRYLPRSSLRTVVAPSKHSVAIAALSELRDVIVPKVTETLQKQTLYRIYVYLATYILCYITNDISITVQLEIYDI